MRFTSVAAAAALVLAILVSPSWAQIGGLFGGGGGDADPKFSAKLYRVDGTTDGVLEVTAEIPAGFHIYAMSHRGNTGLASKISLPDPKKTGKPNGLTLAGDWQPSEEPEPHEEAGAESLYHEGTISWRARVAFEDGVDPAKLELQVRLTGQVCDDSSCRPVSENIAVKFAGAIKKEEFEKLPKKSDKTSDKSKESEATPVAPSVSDQANDASPPSSLRPSYDALDGLVIQGANVDYSFGIIILFALGGGFILNFMPCVLPVIGLKIASFVEQAGYSRGRVIMLNVYYSLGLLTVFMVLATLAAFWSFSWGQQNQMVGFNIVMASIVFAMGLSMIGVWEIPIPGLAMSTGANKLSQKEGPQGAYFKGLLTTVLAVPCSGPGLATAIAYCQNKPPHIIYAVFFFLALGMAAPYLMIGAFPSLIRFLPKPGEWMETFKQVMGFVLLGTVVFLLSYIPVEYVVPTIALLFGIWMACWWFGRVPAWETGSKRFKAALVSCAIFASVYAVSFYWLDDVMLERVEKNAVRIADDVKLRLARGKSKGAEDAKLAWQPYSVAKLGQLTSEKRTVMVDFTADWCLTCKFLEKTVLNTKEVKDLVEQNQVDTLLADWTNIDEEVTESLKKLNSKQIPVLAIFPADNPKKPIVLMGAYSQQTLLDALRRAGPSKTGVSSSYTAQPSSPSTARASTQQSGG